MVWIIVIVMCGSVVQRYLLAEILVAIYRMKNSNWYDLIFSLVKYFLERILRNSSPKFTKEWRSYNYDDGNKKLLIAKINGKLYATDVICTHAYAELSDGFLNEEDKTVTCPLHLSAFDLKSVSSKESTSWGTLEDLPRKGRSRGGLCIVRIISLQYRLDI